MLWLIPGDCVPITWFYTLPLMLPDNVVRCTLHNMMFITWPWHTKMYNYRSWDQYICSDMVLNIYEINRYRAYCTALVNINLVIISTRYLRPMHICATFSRLWWFANFASVTNAWNHIPVWNHIPHSHVIPSDLHTTLESIYTYVCIVYILSMQTMHLLFNY